MPPQILWPDLLLATQAGLFLLKDGEFQDFSQDGEQYFGITWSEHALYVARGSEIVIFTELEENTFHREIAPYSDGNEKLHQLWYQDGELLIVNTGRGRIDSWHTHSNEIRHFPCGHGEKSHHINSLFPAPDGSIFVCDHNGGASHVIQYGAGFTETASFTGIGFCNHNVYTENGILYTLDSTFGNITSVDLTTGAVSAVGLDSSGLSDARCTFGRGFARTPEAFLIGVSRLDSEPGGRNRSAVLTYDSSLQRVDALELPVHAQLYDLRVISGPDWAHNGIRFPLFY